MSKIEKIWFDKFTLTEWNIRNVSETQTHIRKFFSSENDFVEASTVEIGWHQLSDSAPVDKGSLLLSFSNCFPFSLSICLSVHFYLFSLSTYLSLFLFLSLPSLSSLHLSLFFSLSWSTTLFFSQTAWHCSFSSLSSSASPQFLSSTSALNRTARARARSHNLLMPIKKKEGRRAGGRIKIEDPPSSNRPFKEKWLDFLFLQENYFYSKSYLKISC